MLYTSGHIQKLFDITRQTVSSWGSEFSEYLSESANPGKGKARSFTEDDIGVLALVAEMRRGGFPFVEIHASLQNGERADPPPEASAVISGRERQRLVYLENQVKDLSVQLQGAHGDAQKFAGQVELLERQLTGARQEIKELYREIGQLKAKLDDE